MYVVLVQPLSSEYVTVCSRGSPDVVYRTRRGSIVYNSPRQRQPFCAENNIEATILFLNVYYNFITYENEQTIQLKLVKITNKQIQHQLFLATTAWRHHSWFLSPSLQAAYALAHRLTKIGQKFHKMPNVDTLSCKTVFNLKLFFFYSNYR